MILLTINAAPLAILAIVFAIVWIRPAKAEKTDGDTGPGDDWREIPDDLPLIYDSKRGTRSR